MKRFIVLSIILGVMGSNSMLLREMTTDTNLSSKNIQHEQIAKLPLKYSTSIIWFIG